MSDYETYRRFTRKAEFEKEVNSLLGLIEGIAIDRAINDAEIQFLQLWLDDHRINADKYPYSELIPVLEQSLSDGTLTEEEQADLIWLCNKLTSADYFNAVTADLQKLHAILAGVASDGEISIDELRGLSSWLQERQHLKRCWPYDEVEALTTGVLADKKISIEEHNQLMGFFGEFVSVLDNNTIVSPILIENLSVMGVCAVCPEISFTNSVFCLTGQSHKYSRKEFGNLIQDLGGVFSPSITKKVQYLIIGPEGNPCWAYACYGRKVEKAIEMRKKGHLIMLVHENDFHDAIADQSCF